MRNYFSALIKSKERRIWFESGAHVFYLVAIIFALAAAFSPVALPVFLSVTLSLSGVGYLLKLGARPPANKLRLFNYFVGITLGLAIMANMLIADLMLSFVVFSLGAYALASDYLEKPLSKYPNLSLFSKFMHASTSLMMLGLSVLFILLAAHAFPATLMFSAAVWVTAATLGVGILAEAMMRLSTIKEVGRAHRRREGPAANYYLDTRRSPASATISAHPGQFPRALPITSLMNQSREVPGDEESPSVEEEAFVVHEGASVCGATQLYTERP